MQKPAGAKTTGSFDQGHAQPPRNARLQLTGIGMPAREQAAQHKITSRLCTKMTDPISHWGASCKLTPVDAGSIPATVG